MFKLMAVSVILSILPCAAFAGENCSLALLQDQTQLNIHDSSSLALYELIKRDTRAQNNVDLNVLVPVHGVPVKIGGDYDTESADNYFQEHRTQWSDDRLVSVATQTLSREAVEAYKACLGSKDDVEYEVFGANADGANIWVKNNTPGGPYRSNIHIRGGYFTPPLRRVWATGQPDSTFVKRIGKQDIRISLNLGYTSKIIIIDYIPPYHPPAPDPRVEDTAIYVGKVPNVDDGEIATNPLHNGVATAAYGFTIKRSADAGRLLYVGDTDKLNAAVVNTAGGGWRGGATHPIGYAIAIGQQKPGDLPLYGDSSIDRCSGAVSVTPDFQHCNMTLIGFSKAP